MRSAQKLIKNKVLINTFNRAKSKNYLNKKSSYVFIYILLKFKNILKKIPQKKLFVSGHYCLCSNTIKKTLVHKTPSCVIKLSVFLLYFVYIKTHRPTTSTTRFKKSMFLVKFKKVCKNLKVLTINNSGRNNRGVLTIYSKGGIKKKKIKILKTNPWDKQLHKIMSFIRDKRKIVSLCKHSTGSISLLPHISGVSINQTVFSTILPKKYWFNNFPGSYVMLRFLGKFSIFSNIGVVGYKKIANSAGTFCQLVDYFMDFNLIKISLPSKTCVFLSGCCFVLLGKNSQTHRRFCFVGKAGTNKNGGVKPKVRGVARNPVDHPHGGRTKTNKPEVSIWGWVAKRNK